MDRAQPGLRFSQRSHTSKSRNVVSRQSDRGSCDRNSHDNLRRDRVCRAVIAEHPRGTSYVGADSDQRTDHRKCVDNISDSDEAPLAPINCTAMPSAIHLKAAIATAIGDVRSPAPRVRSAIPRCAAWGGTADNSAAGSRSSSREHSSEGPTTCRSRWRS